MGSILLNFLSLVCLLMWVVIAGAMLLFLLLSAVEGVRMAIQTLHRIRIFGADTAPMAAPRPDIDRGIIRHMGIRR